MKSNPNAQEAIEWVLGFAEMDLAHLRPGDQLNLKADFLAFLHWDIKDPYPDVQAGFRRTPLTEQEEEQLTQENFADLQQHTREALQWITQAKAGWQSNKSQADYILRVVPLRVPGRIHSGYYTLSRSGEFQLHVKGDVQAAFLVALGNALKSITLTALRQCPSCPRLFFAAHGKRQFCSDRCKAKEMMRRFRARHPEHERVRARTKYEKKIRKRPGMKNVKIRPYQKRNTQKEV